MTASFHEQYSQDQIKPPSERSTGLVLGAAAAVVAVLWRANPTVLWTAGGISTALLLLSLVAPAFLRPINILWFRLSMLLHRVVNPIIMFAMFVVVFVPAGLMMRLWRDPLISKRRPGTRTYWIERGTGTEPPASMSNQF